jgi:hypothetical protein
LLTSPSPLLFSCARTQIQRGVYSARSGRGLLRLYQFFPSRLSVPVVELIFVHALMCLPDPDFVQCLSLLPAPARTPALAQLVELEQLLQKAQFSDFWAHAAHPDVAGLLARTALAPAFAEAVRAFVAAVLLRTYRRISLAELSQCLGLEEGGAREWAGKRGWAMAEEGAKGVLCELPASADNTPRPVKKVGEEGLGLKFSEVSAVLSKLG